MAVFVWFSAISMIMVGVNASSHVPAMFVFGDSLVDPGNNNYLLTLAKANYYPNGIDFPDGTTGRFCNGKTVADYLGNLLGLPLIPPFNNPRTKGSKILYGVNFGSGGSGILNDTGSILGNVWSMDEQIKNYQEILAQLRSVLEGGIEDFLAESLFLVAMGSNDCLNNYSFSKSQNYSLDDFLTLVIQEYTRQLKDLYKLGSRRFVIVGVGPLGCLPYIMPIHSKNKSECVDEIHRLASDFNTHVKMLVQKLNQNLTGSSFLFWDPYVTAMDIIKNPSSYGFKYSRKACCGMGHDRNQLMCPPLLLPLDCRDRSLFVFWDPYHPSDAFNEILAKEAYQKFINMQ